MRIFLTLLGKEVRALFYSPIAYIVIAVFLLLMGYSFTLTLFLNKYATLIHTFFQSAGLLFLIGRRLTPLPAALLGAFSFLARKPLSMAKAAGTRSCCAAMSRGL